MYSSFGVSPQELHARFKFFFKKKLTYYNGFKTATIGFAIVKTYYGSFKTATIGFCIVKTYYSNLKLLH